MLCYVVKKQDCLDVIRKYILLGYKELEISGLPFDTCRESYYKIDAVLDVFKTLELIDNSVIEEFLNLQDKLLDKLKEGKVYYE